MDINKMDFNIYDCKTPMKTEVLDFEFYEQDNINIAEKNLDQKSEFAGNVNCVKKENDEFEEKLQELEDIYVKSENYMDGSSLDEKTHICQLGKKSLSQNSTLQQVKVHTGRKRHRCPICEKSFTQSLKYHMTVHTGEKNFKCEICQKSFSQMSHLKTHSLLHTGVKNYKCDICEKSFTQRQTLKNHMTVHTGEKNFKCDICNKAFSQKTHLKYHSVLLHNPSQKPEKNYKCNLCEKSFSLKCHLTQHLILHTGVKFKCDICEKSFSTKRSLKRHVKVHPINEKREIKYEDLLDCDPHEQDNDINEYSNSDYKSGTVDKISCVKEEIDEFEEEFHDIGITNIKCENDLTDT